MKEKLTIVLLPGLNGTAGLFKPLMDSAPSQYRVRAITYPTHRKCSYQELLYQLMDTLDDIEGPYVLLGESFSGPLSLMAAYQRPAGLLGVILVATFVIPPNSKVARVVPWEMGFSLHKPLHSVMEWLGLDMTYQAQEPSQPLSLLTALSVELQKVSPLVLADRMQSIFSVDVRKELAAIDVPLRYFKGVRDIIVPKKNSEIIQEINPKVSCIDFDVDHFLLQKKPIEAWREISSFVDSLI